MHASAWASGEGAFRFGGRWNSKGVRAVYCAIDPATAIFEVAVHKGFRALDTVPHVLTALTIPDPIPGAGQQSHGNRLLSEHRFIAIPSAVSVHSWNLIFVAEIAAGAYDVRLQEAFALDTRLHPPTP